MCIAIVKPIGAQITDDAIRNSAAANAHGGGYAFVTKKGKVLVRKGYFNVEKFIEDFRKDEAIHGGQSPALLHFRISTGGKTNEENCHPFEFKHGALIHNGYFFTATEEHSDTNLLVQAIGDHLTKKACEENKTLLARELGTGNKVAILFRDRTVSIINEIAGSWSDGVWFSNGSFRMGVTSRRPGPAVSSPIGTVPAASVGAACSSHHIYDADTWDDIPFNQRGDILTRDGMYGGSDY